MPQVAETPVEAYAHCRNARCPGYDQERIDGIREETSYTFGERGGDGAFTHMIQDSGVEFKAADVADLPCPGCGAAREVTGTPRPSYQNESGHDPMGLLAALPLGAPGVQADARDERIAALEAKIDALLEAKGD